MHSFLYLLSRTRLRRLDVDAALLFLAAPAAGAGIVRVERQTGAGLATDAGISLVIEREQLDALLARVVPHVLRGPIGERADLADLPAFTQREDLVDLQ